MTDGVHGFTPAVIDSRQANLPDVRQRAGDFDVPSTRSINEFIVEHDRARDQTIGAAPRHEPARASGIRPPVIR